MQKHNAMLTPLIVSDTHEEAKKEVEGGVQR